MKNRITAVIIEDEPHSLEFILGIIEIFFPAVQVVAFADDLKNGLVKINKQKPDLIFADIELPDGLGLQLPNSISETNADYHPIFIFISANESYRKMMDSTNSHFLTKPLQIQSLEKIMDPILKNFSSSN